MTNEEFKETLQNNMIQVMEKAKDLFYVEQYTHTYTFQGEKREQTRWKDHQPTPAQALEMLKAVGVSRVNLRFYGGHDSGDVEEVTVEIDDPGSKGFHLFRYDDLFGDHDIGYTKTDDERPHGWTQSKIRLKDALADPIWSKYGSFAGDYSVSGNLVYDCVNNTVKLSGEESSWESFDSIDCLDPNYDEQGMRHFSERFAEALSLSAEVLTSLTEETQEE